mmetsp:Transcript_20901/g.53019  ORF Transcript_20901/g.53019 Transcript_20901/m.53019 type:complete len:227 (+) Transcript_20901:1125-1805(+)
MSSERWLVHSSVDEVAAHCTHANVRRSCVPSAARTTHGSSSRTSPPQSAMSALPPSARASCAVGSAPGGAVCPPGGLAHVERKGVCSSAPPPLCKGVAASARCGRGGRGGGLCAGGKDGLWTAAAAAAAACASGLAQSRAFSPSASSASSSSSSHSCASSCPLPSPSPLALPAATRLRSWPSRAVVSATGGAAAVHALAFPVAGAEVHRCSSVLARGSSSPCPPAS